MCIMRCRKARRGCIRDLTFQWIPWSFLFIRANPSSPETRKEPHRDRATSQWTKTRYEDAQRGRPTETVASASLIGMPYLIPARAGRVLRAKRSTYLSHYTEVSTADHRHAAERRELNHYLLRTPRTTDIPTSLVPNKGSERDWREA